MLFNSYLFILVFLPITLIGFYWIGNKIKPSLALTWLVIASLLFYASWELAFVIPLSISLVGNYILAQSILYIKRGRFFIASVGVIANVLLLLYYKVMVAGLFGNGMGHSAAFSTTHDILIPLGISFITFQQIAFLVDTYNGSLHRAKLVEYCLFITFFPQLIMGPIVHYRELMPQFRAKDFFKFKTENIVLGLSIFIIGLCKKVIIADNIAPYVDQIYSMAQNGEAISPIDAWGVALGFPLQLYFDFSGYADMAIGLGRLFNINLPINFDSPLRATNRFDYWRRWHISFSAFMRQYVFYPLARIKWMPLGQVGALFLTALLSGLWHGLGITFVIWGVIQACLMIIVHFRRRISKRLFTKKRQQRQDFPWFAMCLTFLTTMLLGIMFRSQSLDTAQLLYQQLIAFNMPNTTQLVLDLNILVKLIFISCIIWGLPNTKRFFGSYWRALDQRITAQPTEAPDLIPGTSRLRFAPTAKWAMLMAILLCIAFYEMDKTARFIYYQF